jgi:uncharacterized RDD family membrane protein YckC
MPGTGFGMSFTRPTDVMGRRVGAYVIDLAIAFVLLIVMVLALASSREFSTTAEATQFCDRFDDNPDVVCTASGSTALLLDSTEVWAILLAEAGFGFVNFVLLTGLTGFSFGKVMTGVRVVNRDTGQRCGVARALLRTILLAIPDLFGAVGIIVALSSNDHRRVGDMAASTLVVHKGAVGRPPLQPLYAPSMYSGGYGVAPPPPGYGYPAPQPQWSPQGPQAPQPPWTPVTPSPSPTGTTSWPDFATPTPPTDPDATSVFDTESPTDTHAVVKESAVDKDTKAESDIPPKPSDKGGEPVPGVGAPHWDAKRNTYIQWDPELDAWMQWDHAKSEWNAMK